MYVRQASDVRSGVTSQAWRNNSVLWSRSDSMKHHLALMWKTPTHYTSLYTSNC